MTNVFIALRPLDYYFFGGRRTFGADNANYYVRSQLLPQQTALVGLMRYQMLQNGKGLQEIGDSFDASSTVLQTFGALQSVSPLFLYRSSSDKLTWSIEDCFWKHPLAAHLDKDAKSDDEGYFKSSDLKKFSFQNSNQGFVLTGGSATAEWRTGAVLEGYDAKKALVDNIYTNTNGELIDGDHVFPTVTKVGIIKKVKSKNGKKDRGFYKQQTYKLTKGWAFGFIAAFEDHFDPLQLNGAISTFGGERSLFKIQAIKIDQNWKALNEQFNTALFAETGTNTLTLLSDAFIPERNVYQKCSAAVSCVRDFQNIRTPKGKKVNYSALGGKNGAKQLFKSGQYQLLQKGSVFYGTPLELQQIQRILEEQLPFRGIGYNHFVIR